MHGQNPRGIALAVLATPRGPAGFLERRLETALDRSGLSGRDRALAQELAYGVVRWQATLDWLIARKTAGRPPNPRLQNLLRLGLYQMFWLDRVPPHAAVNETVALAKRSGRRGQAAFVNAVLRGYGRERESVARLLQELKARNPNLGYSHPEWLCHRWQARWGTTSLVRLLEWNNSPAPTYARLNTLSASAPQLTAQWGSEQVQFRPCAWDWTGRDLVFELTGHPPLASLPSFQQGWFYIQDPSTLLAVRALDPQPGQTVLDLCAAPGGKTTFIAQLMNNRGTLMAQDPQPARLARLHENCARLGVTCLLREGSPGTTASAPRLFEGVLVDAPCSNTGVMRRRVELRWRLKPDDLVELPRRQADLLRRAARLVKSGGKLVYSTCSLESEENEEVVARFLAEHPRFRLVSERQLTPFREGVDGAYVARLQS